MRRIIAEINSSIDIPFDFLDEVVNYVKTDLAFKDICTGIK